MTISNKVSEILTNFNLTYLDSNGSNKSCMRNLYKTVIQKNTS